jgi:tRNA uridine 5-carboxymethylaminomethyl modification enzyme
MMAGINAALKLENREPLVFGRDEAYIGVLVDDLTTKGTLEPYRLLTSRAEFRLLLRHDNAEDRLIEKGRYIGLINDDRYDAYLKRKSAVEKQIELMRETNFEADEPSIRSYLESAGYEETQHKGISGLELLRRPNVTTKGLMAAEGTEVDDEIAYQCDIDIKYEGYINKAVREAKKLQSMEAIKLGVDFDYSQVENLSIEGRQKLMKYKPATMGQASRISGVNPADLAVLAIALKQGKGRN